MTEQFKSESRSETRKGASEPSLSSPKRESPRGSAVSQPWVDEEAKERYLQETGQGSEAKHENVQNVRADKNIVGGDVIVIRDVINNPPKKSIFEYFQFWLRREQKRAVQLMLPTMLIIVGLLGFEIILLSVHSYLNQRIQGSIESAQRFQRLLFRVDSYGTSYGISTPTGILRFLINDREVHTSNLKDGKVIWIPDAGDFPSGGAPVKISSDLDEHCDFEGELTLDAFPPPRSSPEPKRWEVCRLPVRNSISLKTNRPTAGKSAWWSDWVLRFETKLKESGFEVLRGEKFVHPPGFRLEVTLDSKPFKSPKVTFELFIIDCTDCSKNGLNIEGSPLDSFEFLLPGGNLFSLSSAESRVISLLKETLS